jgi:transposase
VLKTCTQLEALNAEWLQSSTFSTARIRAIAARLGLTNRKVYKWVYDRKKESSSFMA